jgi:uncharacterized membrane protein YgcG
MRRKWSGRHLLLLVASAAVLAAVLWAVSLVPRPFSAMTPTGVGGTLAPAPPEMQADPGHGGTADSTRSFEVTAIVDRDRSIVIEERITQIFRQPRRGVIRVVPLVDAFGDHTMTSLTVRTSAGAPDDVEVTDETDGVSIRIGDPDTFLTGVHVYALTYRLENMVRTDGGAAAVSLDAITDWDQDIGTVTYSVRGPGAVGSVRCFAGPVGGTGACTRAEPTANGGSFLHRGPLRAGEGLTVELDYDPSDFDATASTTSRRGSTAGIVPAVALLVAGGLLGRRLTARRERGDLRRAGHPLPRPGAPAPIEFEPPLRLGPASMLRLRDGTRADPRRVLAAGIVGLAADGRIRMTPGEKRDTWIIERRPDQVRPPGEADTVLIEALLGDEDTVVLPDPDRDPGERLEEHLDAIDRELLAAGLIARNPSDTVSGTARSSPVLIATVVLVSTATVGAVAGFAGLAASGAGWWQALAGAVTGAGHLGAGTAHLLVGRNLHTPDGLAATLKIEGFERFFADSEAIHSRAALRMGMFREYMGYAVAFGAVDTWLRLMPPDALATDAFGADTGWLADFHRSSTVTSSSRAVAPGGHSGGGGSVGGGSGGGGGGSW